MNTRFDALSRTSVVLISVQATGEICVWKLLEPKADHSAQSSGQDPKKGSGQSNTNTDKAIKSDRLQRHLSTDGAMFSHEPFHVWTGHKVHVIDMK